MSYKLLIKTKVNFYNNSKPVSSKLLSPLILELINSKNFIKKNYSYPKPLISINQKINTFIVIFSEPNKEYIKSLN